MNNSVFDAGGVTELIFCVFITTDKGRANVTGFLWENYMLIITDKVRSGRGGGRGGR